MDLEKSDLTKFIKAKSKATNLSKSRFYSIFVISYAAYDSVCLDLQSVWESSWSKALKAKKTTKIVKIDNLNFVKKIDFSSHQWNTIICNLNLKYDYRIRANRTALLIRTPGDSLWSFSAKNWWKITLFSPIFSPKTTIVWSQKVP